MNNEEIYKLVRIYCLTNKRKEIEELLKENEDLDLNNKNDKGFTFLHIACACGNLDIVELLIDKSVNVGVKDNDGNMPIHLACSNGHKEIVKLLVNEDLGEKLKKRIKLYGNTSIPLKKIDRILRIVPLRKNFLENLGQKNKNRMNYEVLEYINMTNQSGDTPLHLACKNNNPDIVKLLLNNGAKLDIKNNKGITPLGLACINENIDIVNLLVDKMYKGKIEEEFKFACEYNNKRKVEVLLKSNAKSIISEKVLNMELFKTVVSENIDIVDLLLQNGANVNARDKTERTPVFWAINENILLKLIEYNADLNLKDRSGNTALFYACVLGSYEEIVKILLENGARIDEKNGSNKITALHAACENKNFNIVKILLEHGVSLKEVDLYGNNIIHICCKEGCNDILLYIIEREKDVSINEKNENGFVPLHLACLFQNEDSVRILLNKNAQVNQKTKTEKKTPLHIAVTKGNKKIIEMLIDNNAYINVEDSEKITPLHIAAIKGDIEMVKLLIDNGANVNAKDSNNMTPIFHACTKGFKDIVDVLINNGAKVNIKSKQSVTPLQCACYSLDSDIVNMILNMDVDITVVNDFGEDALKIAIDKNSEEIEDMLWLEILMKLQLSCEIGDEKELRELLNERIYMPEEVLSWLCVVACANNKKDILGILIEKGANINQDIYEPEDLLDRLEDLRTKNKGEKLIHMACKKGYTDIVEILLDKGADVIAKDQYGNTPIELASRFKNIEIIRILANKIFEELTCACKMKESDIEKIKTLVEQDVNINLEDKYKNTPIVYACKTGRYDIVNYLLENGFNLRKDRHIKKMLKYACNNDTKDVLECLLDNGADIDVLYKGRETLLMYACKKGKLDIVEYLVEKGIELDYEDKFKKTAIMYAIQSNSLDIVQYLTKKGANINHKDVKNKTVARYAVESQNSEIIKYLITRDNYKEYIDEKDGKTLLMYAVETGGLSSVEAINIKDTINCVDKDGETALIKACCLGYTNIVTSLLKKGADINIRDNFGNNVLAYACIFGYKNIVKYLIKYLGKSSESFINNENQYGVTALIYACDMFQAHCKKDELCEYDELQDKKDQMFIIKYLIENGARINEDAIYLASKSKDKSVYEYLLDKQGGNKKRRKSMIPEETSYVNSKSIESNRKDETGILMK